MAAALDDAAVVDDEDAVGIGDCGQAMGDDQRGAAGRELGERLLDRPLRLRIERRGRLVEDVGSSVRTTPLRPEKNLSRQWFTAIPRADRNLPARKLAETPCGMRGG